MELARCGYCGDLFPEGTYQHECWLARKTAAQETLEPPVQTEMLAVGRAPEDSRIPVRIREIDISNF